MKQARLRTAEMVGAECARLHKKETKGKQKLKTTENPAKLFQQETQHEFIG